MSAFTRSLKDPFPPARSAGIGGLGSTHSYYSAVDMATRIIPSLSHMTVDKDQSVREQVGVACVIVSQLTDPFSFRHLKC